MAVRSGGTRGGRGGRGYVVTVRGYAAFRRDLQKLDKGLNRELSRYMREMGREVRDEARTIAGEHEITGEMRKSIKHSVTQKQVSVYSNLRQAPGLEWGGTISPKGTPIKLPRHQMVGKAAYRKSEYIEGHVASMFDSLKRQSGF